MGRDTAVRSVQRFVIALLLCLAAVGPGWSQPVPPSAPDAAGDFLQEATRALAHGRVEEAAALAATRSAEDPEARVVLARIALRSGRHAEAEALLAPVAEREG